MEHCEIAKVLANWIAQATASPGTLATDTDPSQWVANRFLRWWRARISDELAEAESAGIGVQRELERLGGWVNLDLGEALHEWVHARNALAALRVGLGLTMEEV